MRRSLIAVPLVVAMLAAACASDNQQNDAKGGTSAGDASSAGGAHGDAGGSGGTGRSTSKGGSGGGSTIGAGGSGGAGGATATCIGIPTSTCSSLTCDSVPGCKVTTPGCSGNATECSIHDSSEAACKKQAGCTAKTSNGVCQNSSGCIGFNLDEITCNTIPGCYYNSAVAKCAGTAADCTPRTTSSSCTAQANCVWRPGTAVTCSGTPTPCSNLKFADCPSQNGCSQNITVCSGQPTECSALSVAACTGQPGCRLSTDPTPADGGAVDARDARQANEVASPRDAVVDSSGVDAPIQTDVSAIDAAHDTRSVDVVPSENEVGVGTATSG